VNSGDFHPPDPEKLQAAERSRHAIPQQRRDCQSAEHLQRSPKTRSEKPAAIQAALSQRTSSGATRVMSPAPSVSTTSPERRT
jgi:hypothetical protein